MAHHPYSPSKLEMISLCPASVKLGRGLPDTTSFDAARGTRLHKLVELDKTILSNDADRLLVSTMTSDEKDIISKCSNLISKIETEVENLKFDEFEDLFEKKLSFSYNGKEIYNGTADYIFRTKNGTIIVDWKFGYNPVTEAKDNLQGAAYALAAYEGGKFGDNITVIFFNPIIGQKTKFTFTDFDGIRDYILNVIALAESENPPINPGEKQCRYCKANAAGICPALHKKLQKINNEIEQIKIEPEKAFEKYTDDEIVSFYESGSLVEKMVDSASNELKKRCLSNGKCAGYIIKSTSGGREIENIPEAFERTKSFIPATRFLAACKLSFSKLATEFYSVSPGEVSKKEATQKLEALLAGLVLQSKPRQILSSIKNHEL